MGAFCILGGVLVALHAVECGLDKAVQYGSVVVIAHESLRFGSLHNDPLAKKTHGKYWDDASCGVSITEKI
ncbi:hypothetical protein SPHINGO391_350349 [Sphingomonas aurantiaca]|uniref:Uncharacterized protein n=1 Tax=Sphingomonas aurantiaca TaxID=185949 RepID=A0A5E7Y6I2_9SPHN|nr:hypothetical protein SPHINGO391_350349 [Sphingomonas aurantiaca]